MMELLILCTDHKKQVIMAVPFILGLETLGSAGTDSLVLAYIQCVKGQNY